MLLFSSSHLCVLLIWEYFLSYYLSPFFILHLNCDLSPNLPQRASKFISVSASPKILKNEETHPSLNLPFSHPLHHHFQNWLSFFFRQYSEIIFIIHISQMTLLTKRLLIVNTIKYTMHKNLYSSTKIILMLKLYIFLCVCISVYICIYKTSTQNPKAHLST